MFRYIVLALFFPLLLCADIDKKYSENFVQNLNSINIDECHKILDGWDLCNPDILSTTKGLRAVLALVEGDIIQSFLMIEDALSDLESSTLSPEIACTIRNFYKHAIKYTSYDENIISSTNYEIELCSNQQLRGVKLKYWFGIAQIVTACIIAPFNPPIAGALALSGLNTTIQAAGEALDNKDQWERNLNNRQRMNSDYK